MGITSKQIAELVGVSRGTVDRALHRRGGVKPEIQRRVEMLAREYGYRPDRAGKAPRHPGASARRRDPQLQGESLL